MKIDVTAMQSRLEDMLNDVTNELTTLGVRNPDVPEDWIATPEKTDGLEADANVQADRVEDWDERRATLSLLETRYNNIKRALAKIEAGSYGICEVSGAAIEPERLDANPAARTCEAHMNEESNLSL